jgi:DNA topoisomerase-3
MKGGFSPPKSGHDAGDHPPITPTTKTPNSLEGTQRRLYDFVARHYLGSLSKNAKLLKSFIKFAIGNEFFSL